MYSQIAANKRKTWLLLFVFILLAFITAYSAGLYYGDFTITIGITIGAFIYALFGYFSSAKVALSLSGAKAISKQDNPRVYRMVENLTIAAGMPMPKVYIVNDPAPNAFATGRNPENSHIAFTTGILDILDDGELQGVAAHELSHVQNYDIRVMSTVMVLVVVIGLISDIFLRMMWFGGGRNRDDNGGNAFALLGIVAMILAPIVASLIKLAVSRRREYLADASGALMTRYPDGLASALAKISSSSRPMKRANTSTAHLFLDNPMESAKKGESLSFAGLFSTHPPMKERIKRLNEMGSQL
ncbi:M48 family metalloprotease [Candidatus Saccharibacteria bacterium]|nr:M48 family metalloprotease [Candidatus Saccharibacteria bacterium]